MKGILFLRFGTGKGKERLEREDSYNQCIEYCEKADLISDKDTTNYEFRLSTNYTSLPEEGGLINEMCGIPIPMRGADTVFLEGIKPSSDGSLVISVNGDAGTGKTSFALAMSALQAPIGTTTYYLTFEDNPGDLNARLQTLIPPYLRKLSIYNEKSEEWFTPHRIDLHIDGEMNEKRKILDRHLDNIQQMVDSSRKKISENCIPTPCPLIVVIDGISFLDYDFKSLHKFVQECRTLKVVVILLSGKDNKDLHRLDYLVDTVIFLDYKDTETVTEKPFRILQLIKTRQQNSRAGSHLFHMSSESGFHISPQLPAQLDKQHINRRHLPDQDKIIDIFPRNPQVLIKNKILEGSMNEVNKSLGKFFLKLFPGSQIILHGKGSGGKAGLALKILVTPPQEQNNNKKKSQTSLTNHPRSRILILSFLYQPEYYKKLINTLTKKVNKAPSPNVEYLPFYPGFLRSEDVLTKIIRKLEKAILEGEPFTGVLLDGLHNVLLQFPSLQKDKMLWAMIYNVLIREKVTTVTTFTTFSFPTYSSVNEDMLIEGHIPFLHALVQATDFYLLLEPVEEKGGKLHYKLSAREVIGQAVPVGSIYWQREELFFYA